MQNYKVRVFDSSIETDLAEYMELKTKLLSGDYGMEEILEERTFTKSDSYLIAIHWLEDTSSQVNLDQLKKLLKE